MSFTKHRQKYILRIEYALFLSEVFAYCFIAIKSSCRIKPHRSLNETIILFRKTQFIVAITFIIKKQGYYICCTYWKCKSVFRCLKLWYMEICKMYLWKYICIWKIKVYGTVLEEKVTQAFSTRIYFHLQNALNINPKAYE